MNTCPPHFLLWVGLVALWLSLALAGVWRLSLDYRWIFSEAFVGWVDGLGVQMDAKGWIMAMIPSSFHLWFSRNMFPFFSSSLLHALTNCLALCHCCFSPPASLFLSLWVSTCPVLVTRHHTLSELRGPCILASFVCLPTYLLVALNISLVHRLPFPMLFSSRHWDKYGGPLCIIDRMMDLPMLLRLCLKRNRPSVWKWTVK